MYKPVRSSSYPYTVVKCRKNSNYSDTQTFAVITLKFEQDGFTKE